jgi:hypothetical protein
MVVLFTLGLSGIFEAQTVLSERVTHRDHDRTRALLGFDPAMRLGCLLHRIDPIDNRSVIAFIDKEPLKRVIPGRGCCEEARCAVGDVGFGPTAAERALQRRMVLAIR